MSDQKKSSGWFIDALTNTNRRKKSITADSKVTIGHMYAYKYDPKTKDSLPFWDEYPLVIPIGYYPNGILGLNVHYLPPILRRKIIDILKEDFTIAEKDENKYLKISYSKLQAVSRISFFSPCIKRYLLSHVKSQPVRIPFGEWENAVALQVPKWRGASSHEVYKALSKVK